MSRLAIITGASRGIGKATAERFLAEGWQVANLSRSECDLSQVTNYSVDLTDTQAIFTVLKQLNSQLESASQVALIHNAAIHDNDTVQTIDAARFQQAIEVNLKAPIAINQRLIKQLPKGSAIIYVGSTLAEKAVAGAASYVITKHATAGLMKATCQDLAGLGIHTCCICPGFTATEMLYNHLGPKQEVLQQVKAMTGYNRLIEPSEIADCIWFAATRPVLNGAVWHTNLGQIEH